MVTRAKRWAVYASLAVAGASTRSVLPTRPTRKHESRGFTIIEVLVVVAVVGVLVAVAVPSFGTFMQSTRLRSASSGLYEALTIARSEAIKRGVSVTVSPVGGAWAAGWSVKFGGTTIREWQPEPEVTYRGAATDITYGSSGRIGGDREIVVYIASNSTIAARCVTIDAGGRVNTRIDKDGDQSNGC